METIISEARSRKGDEISSIGVAAGNEQLVQKDVQPSKFVLVNDPSDNEPVEIPTDPDDSLPLVTLEHAFPGAYGLKYMNTATGAKRVVSLDASGSRFYPPTDGWDGKTFTIIFRAQASSLLNNRAAPSRHGVLEQDNSVTSRKRMLDEEERNAKKREGDDGGESAHVRDEYEEMSEEGKDGNEHEQKEESKVKKLRRERTDAVPKTCSDLIVLGLPYDLEEQSLKEYFERFGALELSEIKRDKNGQSRGFGFIRMTNYDDQVRILSIPIHNIGGRECQARISNSDKIVDSYSTRSLSANPRIFVGGLSENINKNRLREFFAEHVHRLDRSASIVDIYYSRPFRKFAFLTLSSPYVAKELVRQRDFVIDGYHCEVTVAAPKKEDPRHASGQLPFGSATGYISPNDPRWNIGAYSTHQYQPPLQDGYPSTGRGNNFYHRSQYPPSLEDTQPQVYSRGFPNYNHSLSGTRGQQNRPSEVWANGGYRHPQANNGQHQQNNGLNPHDADMLFDQLPDGPANSALRSMFSTMSRQLKGGNGMGIGIGNSSSSNPLFDEHAHMDPQQ